MKRTLDSVLSLYPTSDPGWLHRIGPQHTGPTLFDTCYLRKRKGRPYWTVGKFQDGGAGSDKEKWSPPSAIQER